MDRLSYYDFISFPNQEKRDKIRQDFFDFRTLRLCIDDIIPREKETYSFDELSKRKSLFNKIIFFNNNLSYLDLAGLQFVQYYNLFVVEKDNEKKSFYNLLFKQAYRNMCIETKVLEEKIKDFLRLVFGFSPESTKYTDDFLEKLKAKLSGLNYGEIFWEAINRYWKNRNIQKITTVRNNEIHNETTLLTALDAESETTNKLYFVTIKNSLTAILKLKIAFQEFLVKIYPELHIAQCVL